MDESLAHHRILDQKWGIRRSEARLARANQKDLKWAKTKGSRVTEKVQKSVQKDMDKYEKTEMSSQPMLNFPEPLNMSYVNKYNKKLAELMNRKVIRHVANEENLVFIPLWPINVITWTRLKMALTHPEELRIKKRYLRKDRGDLGCQNHLVV